MSDTSDLLRLYRTAAAGKEIPAPHVEANFQPFIGLASEDDVYDDAEPELDCIGRVYGIVYIDAKGKQSQRRITIKSLTPQESDLLVRAYCHERHAARAFKASRISSVVDLETGEVYEDAAELFGAYLKSDPTYDALKLAGPGLQVLAFIARCDGEYHEFEKDCLVEYVMEKSVGEIDSLAVRKHVDGLYPDADSYEQGLLRAAEQGEAELKNITSWLRRVADADGVLANEEFEWLMEAEALLNQ